MVKAIKFKSVQAAVICCFGMSVFLSLILNPQSAFAQAKSEVLPIVGGEISTMAQHGGVVYLGLKAAKGFHYSTDFGKNWNYGAGGDYQYGEGTNIVTSDSHVFLLSYNKVFYSKHTIPFDWQALDLNDYVDGTITGGSRAIAVDRDLLFIGTLHEWLLTFRVTEGGMTLLSQTALDGDMVVGVESIAVDAKNKSMVAQVGRIVDDDAYLVMSQYSYETGAISNLSRFGIGKLSTPPNKSLKLGGVHSNGNGVMYAITCATDADLQYLSKSLDGGKTWGDVSPKTFDGKYKECKGSVSFSADTHVVGSSMSFDGGTTFYSLELPYELSSKVTLTGLGSAINPENPSNILVSSVDGPLFVRVSGPGDYSLKPIDFERRVEGLNGVLVTGVSQSPFNPDLAFFATTGGLYWSENFSAAIDGDSHSKVDLHAETVGVTYQGENRKQFSYSHIRAVAASDSDPSVIYLGAEDLLRGTANGHESGELYTWEIASDGKPNQEIARSIVLGKDFIAAGFLSEGTKLSGRVILYDRDTLSVNATALLGKPVSALAGSNEVLFAGLGGFRSELSDAADETNRGLYRGRPGPDGRSWTWNKFEHPLLKSAAIPSIVYDDAKDTLFVAANFEGIGEFYYKCGVVPWDGTCFIEMVVPGTNRSIGDASIPIGNVLRIENASKDTFTVHESEFGLPHDEKVRSLTLDKNDLDHSVYAAIGKHIFVSNSSGKRWALFFEGDNQDDTRMWNFGFIVVSTSKALMALSGLPVFAVSDITKSVRALTKDLILVKFSREVRSDDPEYLKHIKIRTAKHDIPIEAAKRDALTVSLTLKKGRFPPRGKLKLSIPASVRAVDDNDGRDNEWLDIDYDGVSNTKGSFKEIINLEPATRNSR